MSTLVAHPRAAQSNMRAKSSIFYNMTLAYCRKPPQIKFKLDFGKALGSAYTAKAVRLWLDPFLRETLADLIVWPNRIVVPILPEEVTGPLDDLMLRSVLRPERQRPKTSPPCDYASVLSPNASEFKDSSVGMMFLN